MPHDICTNDLPTLEDTFKDTGHFISHLAKNVRQSQPPKPFAITGYWGSGKTSALAMLYKELTGEVPPGLRTDTDSADITTKTEQQNDYAGIWFEAWRYQNEAVPIVALLQTIKNNYATTAKLMDKAGKLASIAVLGALTVLDGVIKAATGLSGFGKLQAIGEKYEKDNLLSTLTTDQINDALTKAVDVILNGKESDNRSDKRLVIFIDDLDRCEPETAYRLLEGLKLYLNIPNCTIIMAIDPQQIEASLISKFAGNNNEDPQNRFYAVEYMEKLCQDAHRLPVPNAKQRNDFLIEHLSPLLTETDFVERRPVDDLKSILVDYDCLPANPRRLKMLINRIASIFCETDPVNIPAFAAEHLFFLEPNVRDELYAIAVLAVASMSVNYRRLYERMEKCPTFVTELVQFSESTNIDTQYDKPQSVFYEFDKSTTNTSTVVEHPSDLGVFRLKCLFSGNKSVIERFSLTEPFLGDIMHEIIAQYKNPESLLINE